MSDRMERIDRFESVFRSADKPRFRIRPVTFARGLVVCDRSRDEAAALADEVRRYLAELQLNLDGTSALTWRTLCAEDFASVSALKSAIDQAQPDLIVTHRHLREPPEKIAHSLGVYLDEMTQYVKPPVLVLPGRGEVPDRDIQRVMVVTDHLTGQDRLVNKALRFTRPGGTLYLCHIEDAVVFARYLSAVERIPEINTDLYRERIGAKLLREPRDYIQSCVEAISESGMALQVEAIVELGSRVRDYRRLIDEQRIDLLIMYTKDETQLAMHGMSYSIAVEFDHVPLLML